MRLPWLQVNADGVSRARMLGRLLEIGDNAGIGVALQMWAQALEFAPPGDFRGLIPDPRAFVAGCGLNPADTRRVITEMQAVGFVELEPQLRVRGLDRYLTAWRKNTKPHTYPPGSARVPAGDRTGTERVPSLTRQNPERKTETETETDSFYEGPLLLDGAHQFLEKEDPKILIGNDFLNHVQRRRLALGFKAESPPNADKFEQWFAKAVELAGSVKPIEAALEFYLIDQHWAKEENGGCPVSAFCAQWLDYSDLPTKLAATAKKLSRVK